MTTRERVRLAGIACAGGGALWVLVLLAVAAAPETVRGSLTSYRLWEAALTLAQALLLVGVAGLAWSGAAGAGWPGRVGLGIALLERTSFVLGELSSFVRGVGLLAAAGRSHSWGLGLAALLARLAGSTAVAVAGPRAMAERGPAAGAALASEARGAAALGAQVNAGAGAGARPHGSGTGGDERQIGGGRAPPGLRFHR